MKPPFKDTGRFHAPGQTTLQLVLPLLLLLAVLLAGLVFFPKLTPLKTVVILLGLILFVLSFASTEIALYILIFSMLLSPEFVVGRTAGAAALGRGVTLRLDDLILAVIGFSWLARMAINKELGLFLRTPLNMPIAYYILFCLISTMVGSFFGRVNLKTGILFVLKYFEYMIVYFMVVNHLRTEKQIRNYLWALLMTCAIVSIVGIAQIPGGERVSAPFEGEIGEPNTFGGYLVLMMAVTGGLYLASQSIRPRMIYGALLLLFAVPFFYTQSRSSYLAAIPALLAFFWLYRKRQWLAPGLLVLLLAIPFIAPEAAKERIRYTFTQGKNRSDVVEMAGVKLDTSTSARLKSWKNASKDWIQHPILGFGITGYRFVDAQYIRVITETGFLGLILFLFLLYTIFKETRGVYQDVSGPLNEGLTMGYLAGFTALLFHAIGANTFIIVRIMEPFWFLTGMVIMIPQVQEEQGPTLREADSSS